MVVVGSSQYPTHVEVELGCDINSFLVFTLIIQCFIVLKLVVFKGNIWTKSAPVVQLRFLPDTCNFELNSLKVV
jgi:hypothetical protein